MSPLTVGSSIGRTNTEPRVSASATVRGVSCRAFSSSRNAAAGFSVAMLNAFTRSPVDGGHGQPIVQEHDAQARLGELQLHRPQPHGIEIKR